MAKYQILLLHDGQVYEVAERDLSVRFAQRWTRAFNRAMRRTRWRAVIADDQDDWTQFTTLAASTVGPVGVRY